MKLFRKAIKIEPQFSVEIKLLFSHFLNITYWLQFFKDRPKYQKISASVFTIFRYFVTLDLFDTLFSIQNGFYIF